AAPINKLDQRGVLRGLDANGIPNNPAIGDCDIGAFELGGAIRTLQFASASDSVFVSAPTVVPVTLKLDAALGSGYRAITTYVWVSGGTAVEGDDYEPFGVQTIIFNPGNVMKTVTLNLIGTPLPADRTIILSFATQYGTGFSGPARLGAQRTHIITLTS